MTMASLNASLLARKGTAHPTPNIPAPSNPTTPNAHSTVNTQGVPNNQSPSGTPSTTRGLSAVTALQPKTAGASSNRYSATKKPHKKHLRLGSVADRDLRILAAREGVSQQKLLEQAVTDYLEKMVASGECVCGRR